MQPFCYLYHHPLHEWYINKLYDHNDIIIDLHPYKYKYNTIHVTGPVIYWYFQDKNEYKVS